MIVLIIASYLLIMNGRTMMNKYIQFWQYDLKGCIVQCLASDGVCYVDGRLNSSNVRLVAIQQRERLKNVKKGIIGYSVHKGAYSRSVLVEGFTMF